LSSRDSTIKRTPSSNGTPEHGRLFAALGTARDSPARTAFAIGALATLLVALAAGAKIFYFDSGGYWTLSESFTASGHFSFYDFPDALRGYSWPLILWTLRNVSEVFTSDQSLMVRGFNAVIFALVGTVLAPRLASIAWPQASWNIARRLALTAFILAYWSGYLSFPLSDFPALAAALLALVAVYRADSPAWLLVAGFAGALALNIRPAYVLLPLLLVVLLAWSWIEGRRTRPISARRRVLCVVALLAGMAFVSVPQSLSHHKYQGSFNPVPGSTELQRLQYTGGLQLQRYETYISTTPHMEYLDPHTKEIVAGLEGGSVQGTGEYLGFVVDHPLTMAGVFLRHIVNGFDQRYTTPFVETLESDRGGTTAAWHLLLRIGGFLMVFLALVRVAWPAGRRSLEPARWRYAAALLVLAAPSVPSAIETRFLLPAYLLAAMLVITPGWRRALGETWAGPARNRALALVLTAAAAYAVVVWTIVSAATDNLRLS
jgi:hypothetical protein